MASTAGATGWLRGKVKAVPSGDSLVIMGSTKADIPPEKTITLSSLIAPRLARRGGVDEPFAWASREFLRNLCIGKEVTFKVDYSVPSIGRDFGSVFLGDKNVALLVVAEGWAKVKEQGQQKGEASPILQELLRLEEQAKQQGLGRWTRDPSASEASIRNLPPSAIGDSSNFDPVAFSAANKGKTLKAIVEQIRDGSTLRVYLLPDFQFIQVCIAGVQAPSMGRKAPAEASIETEITSSEANGDSPAEPRAPLTSAQRLAASAASITEVAPDLYGREAKHFTELRVLNREIRIIVEGNDKFNIYGSVHYYDGGSLKDLGLELMEIGFAKYVDWSGSKLEVEAKKQLKAAELEAKKARLRMWTNYTAPPSNSKAIHDQNFTGKVVEVVSGDCIVVADDSLPFGDPSAERRVNLSSIRAPKIGNPRRDEKPQPYAREAKEFLRTRLIGKQVHVSMEYSRKVTESDSRVMDFGSVFLPAKDVDETPPSTGLNLAELLVSRGLARVVTHRDFEERSNSYDALLAAEARAVAGKKGMHSPKQPPAVHVTDLTAATVKKARDFLPFLQRNRKMAAVVEYVLSGHRFKLFIPKETCSIALSLSGVRCPGRGEPYSEEAIAVMRRRIMQRDVEIEIETVDRTGTFLGTLWESRVNCAALLLEAGLARLSTFGSVPDANLLARAEQVAKKQKVKIWANYVEGEEVVLAGNERRQKEEMKVVVTEVLAGGKFYVQSVSDQKVAAIQSQLAGLNLHDPPVVGAFNPKKGDIVIAQFSADDSWNRAMVVAAPRGGAESPTDEFEVFYVDYGNQEAVPFSRIRPADGSVASAPFAAQLCSLAFVKVPGLDDDYGQEAAFRLSELLLSSPKEFKAVVEEKDTSGGKSKGQGTGSVFMVTLVEPVEDGDVASINSVLLKEGLARMEKRRIPKHALEELEKAQEEARKARRGMWEYGDVESDDEDSAPSFRRAAAAKR